MTGRQYPFWIVIEDEHILNAPQTVPCQDPSALHAFTSTDKLTEFLSARKGGRWRIDLVGDSEAIVVAVAVAHDRGAANICFDPEPDGTGGELVSIADVLLWAKA